MNATDPAALAVYEGQRDLARRAAVARLIQLERDIVALEHSAPAMIRRALRAGTPAGAQLVAESIVTFLAGWGDEVQVLRHRLSENYLPEPTHALTTAVVAYQAEHVADAIDADWWAEIQWVTR